MNANPPPLRLLQTPRRHRLPVVPQPPSWDQRCQALLQRAWSRLTSLR